VVPGSWDVIRRLFRAAAGMSTMIGLAGWVSIGCPAAAQSDGGTPLTRPGMKTGATAAADRVDYPPKERRFVSASGVFILIVRAVDGWKTPRVAATLSKKGGPVLWQRELPHYHGPRRVLVTDDGHVLLVDEWINVVSRYALTLIGADGKTLASHSAEQVFSLLAVPRRAISEHARFGPWVTEGPELSADGKSALLWAGGRTLKLRLEDGRISAED